MGNVVEGIGHVVEGVGNFVGNLLGFDNNPQMPQMPELKIPAPSNGPMEESSATIVNKKGDEKKKKKSLKLGTKSLAINIEPTVGTGGKKKTSSGGGGTIGST